MNRLLRILAAVALTLLLLYIASTNSEGRPGDYTATDLGLTFSHTSVPKVPEDSTALLEVTVTGADPRAIRVELRFAPDQRAQILPVTKYGRQEMTSQGNGLYQTKVTLGKKGKKIAYYFEATDKMGASLGRMFRSGIRPFVLKTIGAVPPVYTIAHIALLFATVFFVTLAAVDALALLQGRDRLRPMAVNVLLAVACAFLGGYPFGFAMNWYAFGTIWEGVPFGHDATDNKTQMLFLYLVVLLLSLWGSLVRNRTDRNLFAPRTLGWLSLAGFGLMWFIYLIPHSIQFSPGFTYAVCYGWIALMLGLYVVGLLRRRARR